MVTLISQSLYNFSQQEIYHIYPHIYIYQASHRLWGTYNIEVTAQQEKEHKNQGACQALGIV